MTTHLLNRLKRYDIKSRSIDRVETMKAFMVLSDAYGKAEHSVFPEKSTPEELAQIAVDNRYPIITLEFYVYRVVENKRYLWVDKEVVEEKVRFWGVNLEQLDAGAEIWFHENPGFTLEKPLLKTA